MAFDLHVEGQEPIGCTPGHPFWSVDRDEFVLAGNLVEGETLLLYNGDTARVTQKLPRPGPDVVYNIEVHNEHVYHVGAKDVLVHNNSSLVYHGTDSSSAASIKSQGLDIKKMRKAAGDAGIDEKGFSVTTNREIAQMWAEVRAAERGGKPVVLSAARKNLPKLHKGKPGEWADPNELYISPDDFPLTGPGLFE